MKVLITAPSEGGKTRMLELEQGNLDLNIMNRAKYLAMSQMQKAGEIFFDQLLQIESSRPALEK